jgi:hypothetical protein
MTIKGAPTPDRILATTTPGLTTLTTHTFRRRIGPASHPALDHCAEFAPFGVTAGSISLRGYTETWVKCARKA